MKIRLILIALLIVWISGNTVAQSNEIDFSYGTEFDPQGTINEFIGQINDVIYVSSWRKGFILGGVDANSLKQEFEKKIDMPQYHGIEVNFRSIHILDGQLIMFMDLFDRKEERNYLFVQRISRSGNFEGDLVKVDEISAENKRNSGDFSVSVNNGSKRILLLRNPPFDKYAKEKFSFRVLDKNLDTVWEDDLELPYADKYFSISDFIIDENDNLYMLCSFDDYANTKNSDGRKEARQELKARGGNIFTYSIIAFDHKKKKIKEFAIELDKGMKILSVGYATDINGDITISGLYGNKESGGSAIGVFFSKIDHLTQKPRSLSTKEFGKEFLSDLLGDRKADKGQGIANYQVRQYVNRTDGGQLICGEIYYTYRVCTTDPRTGYTSCTTHYVYGSIIVINVTANGDIGWLANIRKNQHSVNDGGFYSSYAMITGGNSLYFLYNDNVKNYNPKKKPNKFYSMTGSRKSITAIAKVNDEGMVSKEPSVKLKDAKMLLRPKVSNDVGDEKKGRLVVLAKGGKKERVVAVSLK